MKSCIPLILSFMVQGHICGFLLHFWDNYPCVPALLQLQTVLKLLRYKLTEICQYEGQWWRIDSKKLISKQVYNRPQLVPFSPTIECDTSAEWHTVVNMCDNVIIYVHANKKVLCDWLYEMNLLESFIVCFNVTAVVLRQCMWQTKYPNKWMPVLLFIVNVHLSHSFSSICCCRFVFGFRGITFSFSFYISLVSTWELHFFSPACLLCLFSLKLGKSSDITFLNGLLWEFMSATHKRNKTCSVILTAILKE